MAALNIVSYNPLTARLPIRRVEMSSELDSHLITLQATHVRSMDLPVHKTREGLHEWVHFGCCDWLQVHV